MQNIHIQELNKLASEFKSMREAGVRRFPEETWLKAVSMTKEIPIADVSRAINTPIPYLRKKMTGLTHTVKSLQFIEATVQPPMSGDISISIDMPGGQRMKIEGIPSSCLPSLISDFFRGGLSCSK
jgi:hypothetical protein